MTARYSLKTIARTGDIFRDFSPYVASINDHGTVAFQAALTNGGSGVFTSRGETLTTVAETAGRSEPGFNEFYSHPDIDAQGALSFYASLKSGAQGVFVVARSGRSGDLAETANSFHCIGPLGPTMNDRGRVAFRGEAEAGVPGVFVGDARSWTSLADAGGELSEFHGLPVLNNRGQVVFRADMKSGGQGIFIADGEAITPLIDTSGPFSDLAAFPILDDEGRVAFVGKLESGILGLFTVFKGQVSTVVDTAGPFESFRGVLIDNAGGVVFYGTPAGGQLGVFGGPDPETDGILSLGQPLDGSTVVDFALNPVSINHRGQLAIRIALEDGRQRILRADRKVA